jgi:hypothetical protein
MAGQSMSMLILPTNGRLNKWSIHCFIHCFKVRRAGIASPYAGLLFYPLRISLMGTSGIEYPLESLFRIG